MFSNLARGLVHGGLWLLTGALLVLAPPASVQAQNSQDGVEAQGKCRTWEALQGKCAKAEPNTDDILDYPNLYRGHSATLEGRVDQIYSPTTFAMQDNYDLIPHGDRILMISVMPVGAQSTTTIRYTNTAPRGERQTTTTVTKRTDVKAPVPAVEMVQMLQNGFEKGKIVRATGTVRMFDRVALEQEFGHIDFGSAPLGQYENQPVLLLGAKEFASFEQQEKVEQQAAVIPPEPQPPARQVERTPEPQAERAQAPEAQPAPPAPTAPPSATTPQVQQPPEPQVDRSLPKTASPMPLVGFVGLLSLIAGFSLRLLRQS